YQAAEPKCVSTPLKACSLRCIEEASIRETVYGSELGDPQPASATRETSSSGCQNVAIGFTGEPVPPLTGIGATVNKNSHRLRLAAASLSASRSQLSKMGTPMAIKTSWWIGCATPSTPDG